MSRKICLITGATSGIGKATALALAHKDWELILIGRSREKLAKALDEIKARTGNEQISRYVCDLSLLQDVCGTAERVINDHARIDVLVNNAGAKILRHQITEEDIELTLATNHLGHFLLTLSLMELLKRSQKARVVNVSSGVHYAARGVIKNILSPDCYDGRAQYALSKLANVYFTYALAAKLEDKKIVANAVDPGGVATNFARNNGLQHWIKHRLYYAMKRQLLTPEQGANTVVFLASASHADGVTGKYFFDMKEQRSSDVSYNKSLQAELWESSANLCSISPDI
jgi:NAD(P)-dependent dehydrogenase (short-subunit alcohol dehydrogenase family)